LESKQTGKLETVVSSKNVSVFEPRSGLPSNGDSGQQGLYYLWFI